MPNFLRPNFPWRAFKRPVFVLKELLSFQISCWENSWEKSEDQLLSKSRSKNRRTSALSWKKAPAVILNGPIIAIAISQRMLHTVFGDKAMHASRVPQIGGTNIDAGIGNLPISPHGVLSSEQRWKKNVAWHEPWNPECFSASGILSLAYEIIPYITG